MCAIARAFDRFKRFEQNKKKRASLAARMSLAGSAGTVGVGCAVESVAVAAGGHSSHSAGSETRTRHCNTAFAKQPLDMRSGSRTVAGGGAAAPVTARCAAAPAASTASCCSYGASAGVARVKETPRGSTSGATSPVACASAAARIHAGAVRPHTTAPLHAMAAA